MSKKDNIYLIGAASYEDTVEQRLTLYNYIRQLAFLAKHMKTAEDYIHLKRAAIPATWTPSGRRSSWTMERMTVRMTLRKMI